jgi:hypothetical protein
MARRHDEMMIGGRHEHSRLNTVAVARHRDGEVRITPEDSRHSAGAVGGTVNDHEDTGLKRARQALHQGDQWGEASGRSANDDQSSSSHGRTECCGDPQCA